MAKKKRSFSPIQVDIVSDIVCPWCWLGSRYFQMAAKKSGRKIELTWRPYMLDPTVPEGGVPYKDYMKKKFGDTPSNRWTEMRKALEQAAPEAGIEFKFGQIPMRPNTLNAHRLMKWAQGQGKGDMAADALFRACFADLKDIGDKDVLANIAGDIEMDAEIVSDLLDSDRDKQAVEEEIDFFRQLGVSGVPTFIYNGQFAIQGAQPVDSHRAAIEKAASMPIPQS